MYTHSYAFPYFFFLFFTTCNFNVNSKLYLSCKLYVPENLDFSQFCNGLVVVVVVVVEFIFNFDKQFFFISDIILGLLGFDDVFR